MVKTEIGSEFWDVPTLEKKNHLFLESAQWFLSGRSALRAIINDIVNCHTVAMPSWCCDSMIEPFIEAGMEIHFYPVYWQYRLVQEIKLDCDILFLMDYFGYTVQEMDLSGFKGIVIRDMTHSLFSKSYSDADYYFGSLRKWCGVWTGGYAWTTDGHRLVFEHLNNSSYVSLREKAMRQKTEYMYGERTDKGFLKIFEEAEESLKNVSSSPAADRDIRLAGKLDVKYIITKRKKNAKILRETFPEWLIFPNMKEYDCPMFVPVLVPDGKRNDLRRFLIENRIYCPIHWPVSDYHRLNKQTAAIYHNELSLVCDQRYTVDDMNRMVETIKEFWKEN